MLDERTLHDANPTDPNAPVYPMDSFPGHRGMTKREAIAMAAMQGLCASGNYPSDESVIAHNAVLVADATIAALNEGEGNEG